MRLFPGARKTPGRFHLAQICNNGHVVSALIDRVPEKFQKYCSTCGAETRTECGNCGAQIRGLYPGYGSYECPAYCHNCGQPYAWTSSALKAARELAAIELEQQDCEQLADIIENLVKDSPQTSVAASRYKKIMEKAKPGVADAFKAILINVTTEGAKKLLFGG